MLVSALWVSYVQCLVLLMPTPLCSLVSIYREQRHLARRTMASSMVLRRGFLALINFTPLACLTTPLACLTMPQEAWGLKVSAEEGMFIVLFTVAIALLQTQFLTDHDHDLGWNIVHCCCSWAMQSSKDY